MVFPFSRSGLKSSGIRYITIGLRRGRVGISVHFAGLFVVVAVGRYKTDVFCFSYFTYIGPEPHNSYSVILGCWLLGAMTVRRIRLWRSTCRRSQFLSGFRVIANIDIRSSEIFPGTCLGDSCPGPLPVSVRPLLRNGRSRIAATDRRPCGNSSAGL